MNKTITTLLAAAGIAASAPASAIIVGGVDFGRTGRGPLVALIWKPPRSPKPLSAVMEQNATAYGFITTVNGDTSYCADGSSNCGLYYVAQYNNSQNFQLELPRIHRYDSFRFLQ